MEHENLNNKESDQLGIGGVMPRELSLHNYWDSNTSEDRVEIVERAFKMIEKQKEYIALLNEELNGLVGMASVHGWKSNLVEEGKKLREEMSFLHGAQQVKVIRMSNEEKQQKAAFDRLKTTGIFYESDEDEDEKFERIINMNDVWGWACADSHEVPMDQMVELLRLYNDYGWCGVLYFVSEREGGRVSEFHHYNRMIEFVKKEEVIRSKHKRYNAYAYDKQSYTVGSSHRG